MKLSGRHADRVKDIEGEALEKLILKNFKDLISRATDLRTLVIVMEDLHWADTSSIELLESIFRLSESQSIVFINVFRPDHKDTGERILESLKEKPSIYYVEIALQSLNEQNSKTLINNMLNIKGLYHSVKDKIIQRSGGNPYFIEEVVRSFIDEGVVVRKNNTFEITDKINTAVIPQTINDVIMARIDRLDEDTRDLLKVASVIGRNFFYKILIEVVTTVDGIDHRLSYLKEIQLIRERKIMGDLEFVFKHALAQEAAYESILHHKRKDLHLKVARSIEKIFKERLYEFYGQLAFHYSKGENAVNAEEYLIKAGEEALKSSASSEALQYYQDALNLYLQNQGDAAAPEKIAVLESNIAQALFSKGRFAEAIQYFDRSVSLYGEKPSKFIVIRKVKLLSEFLIFLISIYFPSLRWKKTPTDRDYEFSSLHLKKASALAITDPKRFFMETITVLKIVSNFDINKMKRGIEFLSASSITFVFPSISYSIGRKILDLVNIKADTDDVKLRLNYVHAELMLFFFTGAWKQVKQFDDNLVNLNIRIGEIFFSSIYVLYYGRLQIEQGNYTTANKLVDKLSEIASLYEHDYSMASKYRLNLKVLLKYRKLHDALIESTAGIDFVSKKDFRQILVILYSLRAKILLLMQDEKEAENSLQSAKILKDEISMVPLYLSVFLLSQLSFDIYQFEKSVQRDDKNRSAENRKHALQTGKETIRIVKKIASEQTEAYRLMGIFFWVDGKQKKALKWWQKSIKEGERLGARLELSRTYFEVGKRLLEPQSKFKSLNNISAEEYLKKAEVLFKEMDLQWDLDELEKVWKNERDN